MNTRYKKRKTGFCFRSAAFLMAAALAGPAALPAAVYAEDSSVSASSAAWFSEDEGWYEDGSYLDEEYDWTYGFADSVMELLYAGELALGDDGVLYTLDMAWWVDPYTGEFFPVEPFPEEEPEPTVTPKPAEEPAPSPEPVPTEEPEPTDVPEPTVTPEPTEAPEEEEDEERDVTDIVDPDVDEAELEGIPEYGSNEDLLQSVQIVHAPEIRKDFRFTTVSQSPFWALHNCFIYEGKSETNRRVGAMPRNGVCYLIEAMNDGWYYVESGDVRGYLQAEKVSPYPPVIEEDVPVTLSLSSVQENGSSPVPAAEEPGTAEGTEVIEETEISGPAEKDVSDIVGEAGTAVIRIPAEDEPAVPEGPVVFRDTETEKQQDSAGPLVIRNAETEKQQDSAGPLVIRNAETEEKRVPAGPLVIRNSETDNSNVSAEGTAAQQGMQKQEQQTLKSSCAETVSNALESAGREMEIPEISDDGSAGTESSSMDSADGTAAAVEEYSETLPEETPDEYTDEYTGDTAAMFSDDGYALATCYIEPWENTAFLDVHKTVQQTVVPKDFALALNPYTAIRENRSDDARIIGLLPERGLCCVLADRNDEWVFVESGDVRGFVRREQLDLPADAGDTSMTDYVYSCGEQSFAIAQEQIRPEENGALYYTITSTREPKQSSYVRDSMMDFAAQFLGNPYVWGGNSLTNGVDCSGFVREIYLAYGYDLPRVAEAQAYVGMQIPVDEAQPGDLIFYAQNGYIYHVVMSTGNGGTIEAMGSAYGIVYSYVNEADAVWATRILEDY